jgi:hypothetical protein
MMPEAQDAVLGPLYFAESSIANGWENMCQHTFPTAISPMYQFPYNYAWTNSTTFLCLHTTLPTFPFD